MFGPTLQRYLVSEEIKQNLVLNPLSEVNIRHYDRVEGGVNYYAITTNFYRNGLFGTYPQGSESQPLPSGLGKALDESTVQRSVNGFGVLINERNEWRVLDTRWYWPLVEPSTGKRVGHVAAYPFTARAQSGVELRQVPDRITIVQYFEAEGRSIVETFEFSGITLGRKIAEGKNEEAQILVWGDGKSDYDNLHWLVKELNNRLNKNSEVLDKHSNPHLQGPRSAIKVGEDGTQRMDLDPEGSFLPIESGPGSDGAQFNYLTWDPNALLNQYQLSKVIDLLHLQTGIPLSAFGFAQNSGSSGVSLERQMFSALSKIRRWRREVEYVAEQAGIEELSWPLDPFSTFREETEALVPLYESGILGLGESRRMLRLRGETPSDLRSPETNPVPLASQSRQQSSEQ